MKKILKASALSFAGIMLSIGAVTASAQSGSIDTTGPNSENVVRHDSSLDMSVDNETTLDASIDINQDASSGEARITGNTEAGDAGTGDADNTNDIEAIVEVDNTGSAALADEVAGCGCGASGSASIERTGPSSTNRVISNHTVDVEVDNSTELDVEVDVEQDAETGDATVSGNTMGGNATTGSASNSSSTVLSFSVHN